jgi:hypothetical protein
MATSKTPIRTVYDNSNAPIGLAEFQTGEVIDIIHGGTGGNTVATAKLQLSLTDSNIRSLISVSGGGSYNNTTGVITINSTDLTPYATINHVTNEIANVVDAAPGLLDTLNELAAAINDDANFATTITTSVSNSRNQANAAYDRANVAVTYAGSAFDKANTLVATVAGVSSTSISNAVLLAGLLSVDGASSNLDSDLLDGQQGSYYLDWTNTTNKPDPLITVTLTGDVSGSASASLIDLASNTITISTTISSNSVELGTDTTGTYVANLVAGTGITITGLGNEGTTPTIAIGQAVGTTSDVTFNSLTVSNGANITGNVEVTGNINATEYITSPYFYTYSDRNLKSEIEEIQNSLDTLNKLQGVSFVFNSTGEKSFGLIAQDVEEILPEIVHTNSSGIKTIVYDSIIAFLIESIKEQQKQIDELKARL